MSLAFLDSKSIKTIEDYIFSLIMVKSSLISFENYNQKAFKEGLLDEAEMELLQTINWDLERMKSLYGKLCESILERSEMTGEELIKTVNTKLMELYKEKQK